MCKELLGKQRKDTGPFLTVLPLPQNHKCTPYKKTLHSLSTMIIIMIFWTIRMMLHIWVQCPNMSKIIGLLWGCHVAIWHLHNVWGRAKGGSYSALHAIIWYRQKARPDFSMSTNFLEILWYCWRVSRVLFDDWCYDRISTQPLCQLGWCHIHPQKLRQVSASKVGTWQP